MKRVRRDNLIKRTAQILSNNEGASLVLVSILAIIVLTAVVILRITTSTFMASSNRQLNQDQAYELAASLGESIDILVERDEYDIQSLIVAPAGRTIYSSIENGNNFSGLPSGSSVTAVVTNINEGGEIVGKRLTVKSVVGQAEYTYVKDYRK
jgi:hypothetical protein